MAANEWVGSYYMTSSGIMAVDTWVGDYYVGSDGKWVPGKTKSTPSPEVPVTPNNNIDNNDKQQQKEKEQPKEEVVPVTKLELSETDVTILTNDTKIIYLDITPSNATDREFTWSSSDPEIVYIEEGSNSRVVVHSKNEGKAKVTATSKGGLSISFNVTVLGISMEFPETPFTVTNYDYRGEIDELCDISSIKILGLEAYTASGKFKYTIQYSGKIVSNKTSGRVYLRYKIYDKENNVVSSRIIHTDATPGEIGRASCRERV
jgi:Bacterial Ig-like domain (group 2).